MSVPDDLDFRPVSPLAGPPTADRPRLTRREPGTHLHPALRTRAVGVATVEYPPDLAVLNRIAEGLRRLNDRRPRSRRAGSPIATDDQENRMPGVTEDHQQRPADPGHIELISLVEIHDIFARFMRKGLSRLIERGEFPEPYRQLVGFSVWDRDEVDRWITDNPDLVRTLLTPMP